MRQSIRPLIAVFAILLGLFSVPAAGAQETLPVEARNAVYFELLGNGLIYSVNYDRRFTPRVTGRIGIGGVGTAGAIPVMVNYLPGEGSHRLELGIGPALIYAPDEIDEDRISDDLDAGLVGTATVGYRYQPLDGGFVFRVGFTPLFGQGGIFPWGGISFGYAF